MPISPQYQWTETEARVELQVSLPGASKSKSDVFATDCMIKVNLAPYLLLLDLHGEVDPTRTVATFSTQGGITFQLFKSVPGLWGQLEAQGSKDELTRRRNASIDRAHAAAEEERKARLERKQKEAKAAVDRQIELERLKRAEIERRKKAELDAERSDLTAWQQGLAGSADAQGDESDYEDEEDEEGAAAAETAAAQGHPAEAMPDHPDYHGKGWRPTHRSDTDTESDSDSDQTNRKKQTQKQPAKKQPATPIQDAQPGEVMEEAVEVEEDGHGMDAGRVGAGVRHGRDESWRPLPPPRLRLEPVKVAFTTLEMPHLPAREQREEELRAYKKSVAQDRALLADSQDVSDRQPVFLKDKGDGLFRQGNYRGAIAAYTRALELDPSLPQVWSNKAAAHAKVGEHQQAAEDCGQALELLRQRVGRYERGDMEPEEVAAFKSQLVKVLVRRAAARTALGQLTAAVTDYEEAVKYDPGNETLCRDLAELRAAMAPADPVTLRQRGAARFAAGDHHGAVEAFSALLTLLPLGAELLPVLSNRAAARLVLGQYEAAHEDCCLGLAVALCTLGGGTGHTSHSPVTCEELGGLCVAAGSAWGLSPPHASLTRPGSKSESEEADRQLHAWLRKLDGTCTSWLSAGGSSEEDRHSSAVSTAELAPESVSVVQSSDGGQDAGSGAGAGGQAEEDRIQLVDWRRGLLAAVGRLLARRAAVRGHMRRYRDAQADFESAAHVTGVTGGGDEKQRALLSDAQQMAALCEGPGVAAGSAGREQELQGQAEGAGPQGRVQEGVQDEDLPQ